MTTGCFPAPIQGELLYGVLARHRLLSGARTAADHATELFGRRAAIASFDLPCRLDALAARLPATAGLDGTGLLSHTLYRFYAAFQTRETRVAVEHDLRASGSSNAHHRLGVAAFRVRAGQALRFCPACFDLQRDEIGIATWLVAHQLPGVLVCHVHGESLRDSLVTRKTAGRHGYVAPTEGNCPRQDGGRVGDAALLLLQSVSCSAAALSASLESARPLGHWRDHYVQRLAGVGLMRSERKVDQAGLNDGLKTHWGAALPYLPAPCSTFGESGWAAAMVRSHRKAMHPLFHLLLDGFVQHLEHGGVPPVIPEGKRPGGDPTTSAKRPAIKPVQVAGAGRAARVDWEGLDAQLCSAIQAAAVDVRAVAPPIRVSKAEVERRVAKTDWFGKRRRKVPLAVRALARVEESVSDYRRRRATYWIGELGPSYRPWEVMRAAGLRSEQLPMIRAAMAARGAASGGR